jgi:hypothetical protein
MGGVLHCLKKKLYSINLGRGNETFTLSCGTMWYCAFRMQKKNTQSTKIYVSLLMFF